MTTLYIPPPPPEKAEASVAFTSTFVQPPPAEGQTPAVAGVLAPESAYASQVTEFQYSYRAIQEQLDTSLNQIQVADPPPEVVAGRVVDASG